MSVEARLYHAEQQIQHASKHLGLLKKLITTEVRDLRKSMEQQVAEVKQLVMYQDRFYQERMSKLEERIKQLSEFCLYLARATGHVYPAVAPVPTEMIVVPPEVQPLQGVAFSVNKNTMLHDGGDDDDGNPNEKKKDVDAILETYKDRINTMYDFYTASSTEVFHPTMTMTHFSRMLKDCQLCGISQGTSAELLWMAVMRSLNRSQRKHLDNVQAQNRGITLGRYVSATQQKNLFAFQRLETIPKELFGEALYLLAMEKRRLRRLSDGTTLCVTASPLDEKPKDVFLAFLLYHIFPYVDAVIEEKERLHGLVLHPGFGGNCEGNDTLLSVKNTLIPSYKTNAVASIVKEFMRPIKEGYTIAIRSAQGYSATVMNLDGFVELARRHELLPLIRKPVLRHIFLCCCAVEKEEHPEAEEGAISVGTFLLALYYLADQIYGDPLMGKRFSTPEARIKKLLSKMFILS
ncbi:hypothetical protein TraAM80_06872 [Trypanosoma rangeli]|uniref:Uncharacterized protein n=1 Tax=Trypanosoma rangeli TaxID=5698 RepID=A0A3R7K4P6_TRYRA|nr:uncharacterized protein TraAM80_06872 [Trypanosoma rangeli]RNF01639.1 hypothetical protein TraAM80_06872 [Trypanosoma rangeli]|eukprot:RNF01639.1 hypothetical protein TraAM80_06872 [Trypanosoma rangeli]